MSCAIHHIKICKSERTNTRGAEFFMRTFHSQSEMSELQNLNLGHPVLKEICLFEDTVGLLIDKTPSIPNQEEN